MQKNSSKSALARYKETLTNLVEDFLYWLLVTLFGAPRKYRRRF